MNALEKREFDPLVDELPCRYVVGIDLGTTNSAVAYVDTHQSTWQVRDLPIHQLVAPGQAEARETLPSFHYQATAAEALGGALRLPWSDGEPSCAVGFFARDQGMLAPGRLIASAKSWLCHSGVDRTAELLPWQGAADVDRLSPIEVTARYLRHIRDNWENAFRDEPLARQQVVITLPASFDEVARELTVRAAADAGLPRVVLIEEPQAAFYAWVYRHDNDWHLRVESGQKILVCDIGGGTTDFTLISVRQSEQGTGQKLQFHRVAVGNHLILGGDNLDLALAHHVERKLAGDGKLPPQQWDVLVRSARRVKETLLGSDPPSRLTVNLPGAGSKVIGGGLQVEVERREVEELLVEGFLPRVKLDEQPRQRQSAFQEFGLPYAADHAITRYLAAFLRAHSRDGHAEADRGQGSARPDIVLFNGGFFASPALRARLLEVLTSWFQPDDGLWEPDVLDNDRLDLAVARGAAYYGMVQRGQGVQIAANLARSYYIGVTQAAGAAPQAVCLIPGDAESGREIELPDTRFALTIAEPVEFPLFVSSTRLTDRPGEVITLDPEQTTPLPPIRTVLRAPRRSEQGTVPVHLHARLTEIGTIDLWCSEVNGDRTWRLQFDIRSTTLTDLAAHESAAESEGFVEESQWQACHELVARVFAADGKDDPATLIKRLAEVLAVDRSQWPTSLLRRLWEALMEFETGRRRSAAHQSRWLNLLGYALRPGYGLAMDDWRVDETWRTVRGKLTHVSGEQGFILWRRVAGGLSRGKQLAIAEPSLASVRALHRRLTGRKKAGTEMALDPSQSAEMWRLLGSLELLSIPLKIELGDAIAVLLPHRKMQKVRDAMIWALGRLGQRVPVYGPLNTVVPAELAAKWLQVLLARGAGGSIEALAAMQLARRTDDRHRDLSESLRQQTVAWIRDRHDSDHLVKLIRDGGRLDHEEQNQIVGESLPRGLRIL
jgi:molecular chaperone DnaK (HSP70)